MYKILFAITFILNMHTGICDNQNIKAQKEKNWFGATPSWVMKTGYKEPKNIPIREIPSGNHLLLLDSQVKVAGKATTHYIQKILRVVSAQGVSTAAQLEIDFNPAFEKIKIHDILVHRDGKTRNMKAGTRISALQRESNLENSLMSGQMTLSIILDDDIRVGDIIEYAYSITGSCPLFLDRYYGILGLQWNEPVNMIRYRFIAPLEKPLFFHGYPTEISPAVKIYGKNREYLLEYHDVPAMIPDQMMPEWHLAYPCFQVCETQTWNDVARMIARLYTVPQVLSPELASKISEIRRTAPTDAEKITEVFNFVRENIRYMGFEQGEKAYTPGNPSDVFGRRYGDCKDKTLLAITMLQSLGVKAAPVMVHSQLKKGIYKLAPSPNLFDHVIVYCLVEGKPLWFDTTSLYARGKPGTMALQTFGYGLIVGDTTTELTVLRDDLPNKPTRIIKEIWDLSNGFDQPVKLDIRQTHIREYADNIRAWFSTNSPADIRKNYLSRFSENWPDIKPTREIHYKDHPAENRFEVWENYLLQLKRQDDGSFEFMLDPFEFGGKLSTSNLVPRTAPLGFHHPVMTEKHVEIRIPWNIELADSEETIQDKAFLFKRTIVNKGDRILVTYLYQTFVDEIRPEEAAKTIENYQKIEKIKRVSFKSTGKRTFSDYWSFRYHEALFLLIAFLSGAATMLFILRCPIPTKRKRNKDIPLSEGLPPHSNLDKQECTIYPHKDVAFEKRKS